MSSDPPLTDAYPPAEIARKVEQLGVSKAHADTCSLLILAILAGAFISLGALLFSVVITGSELGLGPSRLLAGLSFCLGLILVVVAGAELFTGNNLIAMAWACGDISSRAVIRNWILVYIGNVFGCLATVLLVILADSAALGEGALAQTAVSIAAGKSELGPIQALMRGILCNALVCLAVWLAIGARSVTDKILAIVFPVTAFVALGFEHSIANWFFLSFGLLLDTGSQISVVGAAQNLLAVTVGNILGGTVLVAGVYWVAYLRNERLKGEQP